MNSGEFDWGELGVLPDPTPVRKRLHTATAALLGDTIRLDDEAWRAPTRLPGWTRAHVASHIARNADALRHLVEEFLAGHTTTLYADNVARAEEVQTGSLRDGLDQQIDLDTSAGQLDTTLDLLGQSGRTDPLWLTSRVWIPAPVVSVARLAEVILHYIDLDCGFTPEQIDAADARWLAAFELTRAVGDPRIPPLLVHTESGLTGRTGDPAQAVIGTVNAPDVQMLGWIGGRRPLPASCLSGAAPDSLPLR